jgi:hypothetical protein
MGHCYSCGVAQPDGTRQASAAVVRVFAGHEQAREAIRALEAAGVDRGAISVVTRSPDEAETLEQDTGASEELEDATQRRHPLSDFVEWLGKVESVAVPGFGAVLGTGDLWQDVSMAAGDRGAITGALVGMGIPVDTASEYEQAVLAGQILVVVHGAQDPVAIESILSAT